MTSFRLILDTPAGAAWNMAVDETLLDAVARGDSPPTFRVYSWSPAAISIGRFQSAARVLAPATGLAGVSWVRRPTGGRAVYHADEITYSIVLPNSHPLATGGLRDVYFNIGEILRAGLSRAGVSAISLEPSKRRRSLSGAACFDAPGDFELLAAGRKLVGSAQLRRAGGVLQHGSIPISNAHLDIVDKLALTHQERIDLRAQLETSSTYLGALLPAPPDRELLNQAFAGGVREFLGDIQAGSLTGAEQQAAAELEASKYLTDGWSYAR